MADKSFEEDRDFQTETFMEQSESYNIEDMDEDTYVDESVGTLSSFVEGRFTRAEKSRYSDEERWVKAYRNYRGVYGPDVQFTSAEKSQVFVKVTKTKTLAAYGQITDVLFGNNKFPLVVDPTSLPEGVVESVHFEPDPNMQRALEQQKPTPADTGIPMEEFQLRPGETLPELTERLAGMRAKLEPIADKLVEGPGNSPTAVTFHPALVAAKKMQKKIHDQLEESNASKGLRQCAFECALFGTGIMKGPMSIDKEYPKWNDDGEYDPVYKTIPSVEPVSIWDFYPDPEAHNMDEAEYVIQRHKMSRKQLKELNRRPFFRRNAIDLALKYGTSYEKEWWEQAMEDDQQEVNTDRYEVLEFWGYVDRECLEENDVEIDDSLEDADVINMNVWVCNGVVIRAVMNPFTPQIIPYFAVPYEVNPYSFFGVGLAENMDDSQVLMNGFMRMAVDNAALSGNLLIEVDETALVPGQDMSIYPGKVFRRQSGAPGQAIFGTKFPNVSNENMQMFDKARVLADESTGFPSYAHGQTGVQGVGRTASGISMLMDAASGSIKTVVKNFDDYLLGPLGKALFAFNMQFDYDPEIKGDLEVKAQGTSSLMANEVRSQRLMQFLGLVQNPVLAPFAKMEYIIREIALAMDLDPDKVTNSMSDAAVQAEVLRGFAGPEQQVGGPVAQQAGTDAMDPTGAGGGTIGTGMAPRPQEQGFSGNSGVTPDLGGLGIG